MAVIHTENFKLSTTQESRFLHIGKLKLPVFVRPFTAPNDQYAVVVPQGYLVTAVWTAWTNHNRHHASFDPKKKCWVWSMLKLAKFTDENTIVDTTTAMRDELRKQRKIAEEQFDRELAELSANENVPEERWADYKYPAHLPALEPAPTALQRILVSRYWNEPSSLIGASVGSGKSRIIIDCLTARALAPNAPRLNNSARIVLLVAPLSLHENWKREFTRWKNANVSWHTIRYEPTVKFWNEAEDAAQIFFDVTPMKAGGIVIICTPQTLSRPTLFKQLADREWVPSGIVIDEAHRFFRRPTNRAYKTMTHLAARAHCIYMLTGTPTAKLEDYFSYEVLLKSNHFKNATHDDYQQLGDPLNFTNSGLHENGWNYDRGIKGYHSFRISQRRILLANKNYYMKDALPCLEQAELGEFADTRISFSELFEKYPAWVDAAHALQQKQNEKTLNETALATTLLLRLQQLASVSEASQTLLKNFVNDFLEPDEPCIFWTLFRNDPTPELPTVVKTLLDTGSTVGWIEGGMPEKQRWAMLDAFDKGSLRFMVLQLEAGGVGLNLVRSNKAYYNSVPLSYLSVTQADGRIHRIGQEADSVTSYFAMNSPVASFARRLYDTRRHLNQTIPENLGAILQKYATKTP